MSRSRYFGACALFSVVAAYPLWSAIEWFVYGREAPLEPIAGVLWLTLERLDLIGLGLEATAVCFVAMLACMSAFLLGLVVRARRVPAESRLRSPGEP